VEGRRVNQLWISGCWYKIRRLRDLIGMLFVRAARAANTIRKIKWRFRADGMVTGLIPVVRRVVTKVISAKNSLFSKFKKDLCEYSVVTLSR
jgi:hypothetical protein